jgi:very-short-patch-repair endonuclease
VNKNQNPDLTHNAQRLRKDMTKEERHLWYDFLKDLPVNFNRQKVIGKFIVDFYCASANLVIELDGAQHFEKEGLEADKIRDNYLNSIGLTLKRYSNNEINSDFEQVCDDIYYFIFPDENRYLLRIS